MSKKLLILEEWEPEKENLETEDIKSEKDHSSSITLKMLNSRKPLEISPESKSVTLADLIYYN